MWTCPKCRHQFYNKNQSHSCGSYTVDDFLKGRPAESIWLFESFLDAYRRIGPFDLHPVKTRVALLTQMRFCSINKIGSNYIDIHLVLVQPFADAACFYKIDNLGDRFFVHHARLCKESDITSAELTKFMEMAYQTGLRLHVQPVNSGKQQ